MATPLTVRQMDMYRDPVAATAPFARVAFAFGNNLSRRMSSCAPQEGALAVAPCPAVMLPPARPRMNRSPDVAGVDNHDAGRV